MRPTISKNNECVLMTHRMIRLILCIAVYGTITVTGAHAAPARNDLAGTWLGVYQTTPQLIRITLQLPPLDGTQSTAADGELRIEPLVESRSISINRPPMGVVRATISFDGLSRTVTVTPTPDASRILGTRLPTFSGVLNPDGTLIAGVTAGVAADENPYFVLGRQEVATGAFLRKLEDVATFTQRIPSAGVSILEKFGGGGAPDKSLAAWAQRFIAEYPDIDAVHVTAGALFQKGRNLFRDDSFRPYFGKNYDDLGAGDLMRRYMQIQKVPLPRGNFPEEKPNGVIASVRNGFFPGPGSLNARDIRLAVIATRVMNTWRVQSLRALRSTSLDVEGWRAAFAGEQAEKSVLATFWPSERQEFAGAVLAARNNIATPLLTKEVQGLLAEANSFAYVSRLRVATEAIAKSQPRSSPETSLDVVAPFAAEPAKNALIAQLGEKRNQLIDGEVASQTRDAKGYDGLQSLLALDSSLVTEAASGEQLAPLRASIGALNAEQAAQQAADYESFASQVPSTPATLAEAKSREAALAARYGSQLNAPEYATFNEGRRTWREKWLTAVSAPLSARIEAAESVSAVQGVFDAFVVAADLTSAPGKTLQVVAQRRKDVLAPFSSFAGGDYLNAIYDGDAATVRSLDAEYLRTYSTLMQSVGIGALVDSFTLVQPVLATYMFNYDTASAKCLRPDAKEFVVTSGTDWVTQNGWGQELSRTAMSRTETHYRINPEFVRAFEALGESEPDSAAGLDRFLFGGNIAKVVSGTHSVMRAFPCSDPRILRLERNMLALYDL